MIWQTLEAKRYSLPDFWSGEFKGLKSCVVSCFAVIVDQSRISLFELKEKMQTKTII